MHEIKLNEQTETDCFDEASRGLNYPQGSSHFQTPILSDNEINIFHIFAENGSVKRSNDNQLKHIPGKLITIPAKDEVSKNSKISNVMEAQNRKTSETGGLASILELKINARVMLTTNINSEDRLINGQKETVKYIEIRDNEVRTIYLELDERCAEQLRMKGSDIIAKNNKRVPIKREETSIYLNKHKTTSPAIKRTQFIL